MPAIAIEETIMRSAVNRIVFVNFMSYPLLNQFYSGIINVRTPRRNVINHLVHFESFPSQSHLTTRVYINSSCLSSFIFNYFWCPRAELNHRHKDFQSSALPTDLLGHQNQSARSMMQFLLSLPLIDMGLALTSPRNFRRFTAPPLKTTFNCSLGFRNFFPRDSFLSHF